MEFFALGKIIKTRGLRGCLKVICYTQDHSFFADLKHVYLDKPTDEKNKYQIKKIDLSGKFFFIELQGIANVEAAAPLIGATVFISKALLPELPDGEYYWRDIIGLDVFTEEEEFLGRIEAIFPTGSNDVYVCKRGDREILLPAINQLIRKINVKQGIITVKLPKGL